MGSVLDRLTGMPHDHRSAVWQLHGFDQPIKDMSGATGPCDKCADARCPVGNGLRLTAFRTRAAQLVARYGYDLDVEVNRGAHGIDLRCVADGVTWIWEFSRDDPASIAQAVTNRDHIVDHLRQRGVDARPGPAFAEAESRRDLFALDRMVQVSSHSTEPGIELIDVYYCEPCETLGQWLYRDSLLRTVRLEDLVITQMAQRSASRRGEPMRLPNVKRQTRTHVHLHLSLRREPGDWPGQVLRTWFTEGIRLLDRALAEEILAAPDAAGGKRAPGTPAGELVVDTDWYETYETKNVQLTAQAWAGFLDGLDRPPPAARAWFGPVNEHGWALPEFHGGYLEIAARFHDRDFRSLALTAKVNGSSLDAPAFQARLLEVARTVAERVGPDYGEIGYQPYLAETGVHDLTMLERLLYRDPTRSIATATRELRGYSWLTILPPELTATLGDVDHLRHTGAFWRADKLPNGGCWLLATEHFDEYDEAAARRVFHALAPVLPPGRPARSRAEPHMIILADASQLGRPQA